MLADGAIRRVNNCIALSLCSLSVPARYGSNRVRQCVQKTLLGPTLGRVDERTLLMLNSKPIKAADLKATAAIFY